MIAQSSGLSSSPASALFMQQQHTCNHEWQPYYQRFLADCQNRQLERSCSTHRRTSWRPHIFENNASPSESTTIYRLKKESGVQSISYNNHSHTSQKQSFTYMGTNVTDHMWEPDRAWVAYLPVGSGTGRHHRNDAYLLTCGKLNRWRLDVFSSRSHKTCCLQDAADSQLNRWRQDVFSSRPHETCCLHDAAPERWDLAKPGPPCWPSPQASLSQFPC